MTPPPPHYTLFPYTTLFRSSGLDAVAHTAPGPADRRPKRRGLGGLFYDQVDPVATEAIHSHDPGQTPSRVCRPRQEPLPQRRAVLTGSEKRQRVADSTGRRR